jgi:hypothetical protein
MALSALLKEFEAGKSGVYKMGEMIFKVEIVSVRTNESHFYLQLRPVSSTTASENEDENLEYFTRTAYLEEFDFGGLMDYLSCSKKILNVVYCGSLNINPYSIDAFDRQESNFNLLWLNI